MSSCDQTAKSLECQAKDSYCILEKAGFLKEF